MDTPDNPYKLSFDKEGRLVMPERFAFQWLAFLDAPERVFATKREWIQAGCNISNNLNRYFPFTRVDKYFGDYPRTLFSVKRIGSAYRCQLTASGRELLEQVAGGKWVIQTTKGLTIDSDLLRKLYQSLMQDRSLSY